jgi:hypothetical protein
MQACRHFQWGFALYMQVKDMSMIREVLIEKSKPDHESNVKLRSNTELSEGIRQTNLLNQSYMRSENQIEELTKEARSHFEKSVTLLGFDKDPVEY